MTDRGLSAWQATWKSYLDCDPPPQRLEPFEVEEFDIDEASDQLYEAMDRRD